MSKCSILSRGSVSSRTLQFLVDVKAVCVILIVVTRWSHSSHTWTGCWNAVTDTQLKTTANSLHTHSHSAEHIKASDSSGQLSWQKSNTALKTFLTNVCAAQLCVQSGLIKWFMTVFTVHISSSDRAGTVALGFDSFKGYGCINHTHSLIQVRIFFLYVSLVKHTVDSFHNE